MTQVHSLKSNLSGFFSKPFPLLDDNASKLFLVGFCGVFATFFIYFYNPFNLQQLEYKTAIGRFLSIWNAGIIGALILSFTQFFLRKVFKLTTFTLGQFLLWVLLEYVFICLGMYVMFGESHVPFAKEFMLITRYTVSLAVLPYFLACLILAVYELSKKVRQKEKSPENTQDLFRDENGKIMLALKPSQTLFLKSDDNYTSVFFLQNKKVEKKLIRNTLKNLEEQLDNPDLIRIHRSYMVNLQKVISVTRTKRGFELTMEQMPDLQLSVSETYKLDFESQIRNEQSKAPTHPK